MNKKPQPTKKTVTEKAPLSHNTLSPDERGALLLQKIARLEKTLGVRLVAYPRLDHTGDGKFSISVATAVEPIA